MRDIYGIAYFKKAKRIKLWDDMALPSNASGEQSQFAASPRNSGEAVTIPSDQSAFSILSGDYGMNVSFCQCVKHNTRKRVPFFIVKTHAVTLTKKILSTNVMRLCG